MIPRRCRPWVPRKGRGRILVFRFAHVGRGTLLVGASSVASSRLTGIGMPAPLLQGSGRRGHDPQLVVVAVSSR